MPPAILRFDPRLQRPSSAREGVKKAECVRDELNDESYFIISRIYSD